MAGETPQSHHTRCIETSLGILRYSELIPLLAEKVLLLEQEIAQGKWQSRPLNGELVLDFHLSICGAFVPDWAGRWRKIEVTVGTHTPPLSHEVPLLMLDYFRDANARLEFARTDSSGELLLEALAFIEGRFLSIHPFPDFNARVIRVLLQELCQRLELPSMDLAPDESGRTKYIQALRSADQMDWEPLKSVWKSRLTTGD